MENEPQNAYLPGSDADALEPFDVRRQTGKRGLYILLGILAAAAITAYIIMTLFSSGTRGRDEAPRILADNDPYKQVPEDPGGDQTPNQKMGIYDVSNGTNTEGEVTTVPPTEDPMQKPAAIETQITPPKPAANVVIKETVKPKPAPAAKPVPAAVKPASRQQPSVSGDYVVQVAALRSRAQADALWTSMSEKMDGVIGPAHYADIKRVNLEDKGVYYRLRIGGLKDKAAATNLCSRLKARGQDCFVKIK